MIFCELTLAIHNLPPSEKKNMWSRRSRTMRSTS
jgi:hypothetical protein